MIIGDAAADPRTANNPSIKSMGVAAWAGYPLLGTNGDVLGTFCVVDTVVREWSEQDVHVLATLAAAASAEIALRDAASTATAATVAVAAQSAAAWRSSPMSARSWRRTADAEVAVGLLAERIVTLLCDWCLITVIDDVTGKRRDLGHAHRDPARTDEVAHYAALHVVSDDAPSADVLRTGRPTVLAELDATVRETLLDPQARAVLAELNPSSAAIFPLQGRGAPFGLITLLNGPDRGAPTEGELSIARELSRRAGLSLENARLLSHHRRIADVLQASMLTEPPAIDDLQMAVRYLPASEDAQVGGDWYDAFVQPDGADDDRHRRRHRARSARDQCDGPVADDDADDQLRPRRHAGAGAGPGRRGDGRPRGRHAVHGADRPHRAAGAGRDGAAFHLVVGRSSGPAARPRFRSRRGVG